MGVARILSGVHFLRKKKLTTFFTRRHQKTVNELPNLPRPVKKCPKIDAYSPWGCTSCAGVHLNFSCKLHLVFSLGVCMCTHCTPWLRLWLWSANMETMISVISAISNTTLLHADCQAWTGHCVMAQAPHPHLDEQRRPFEKKTEMF